MFKSQKHQYVRPEGQDLKKYIKFEVFTLSGSNRFKKIPISI